MRNFIRVPFALEALNVFGEYEIIDLLWSKSYNPIDYMNETITMKSSMLEVKRRSPLESVFRLNNFNFPKHYQYYKRYEVRYNIGDEGFDL